MLDIFECATTIRQTINNIENFFDKWVIYYIKSVKGFYNKYFHCVHILYDQKYIINQNTTKILIEICQIVCVGDVSCKENMRTEI